MIGRLQTSGLMTPRSRYIRVLMTIIQCTTHYVEYLTLHNTPRDNFSHTKTHFSSIFPRETPTTLTWLPHAYKWLRIRNLSNAVSIIAISKLSIFAAPPHDSQRVDASFISHGRKRYEAVLLLRLNLYRVVLNI